MAQEDPILKAITQTCTNCGTRLAKSRVYGPLNGGFYACECERLVYISVRDYAYSYSTHPLIQRNSTGLITQSEYIELLFKSRFLLAGIPQLWQRPLPALLLMSGRQFPQWAKPWVFDGLNHSANYMKSVRNAVNRIVPGAVTQSGKTCTVCHGAGRFQHKLPSGRVYTRNCMGCYGSGKDSTWQVSHSLFVAN